MGVEKLYRPANVSKSAAVAALFKARPDADLVSFKRVANVNGKIVEDPKGGLYEVTLKVAGDFPPSNEDSESEAPEPKEEPKEDAPADDAPSDDAPDEGGAPDFGGGEEGGEKPKKLNPQEETVSLLRQILHALQGGAGPDAGGMGDADLGDPTALPDVGAPPAGGGLPHGGPGGPPLPPPVPNPHHGPAGGGAFANVHPNFRTAAVQSEFKVERADARNTGPRALIREIESMVPTHKVTAANLDEFSGIATLTLVAR